MNEQQSSILEQVLVAAIAALRAAAMGLAIFALGTVALAAATVALLTTVLGAAFTTLAGILKTIREWLKEFVKKIVHALCLVFPVIAAFWSIPNLHAAFGGDEAAFIPAVLLSLFPAIYAAVMRPRDAGVMIAAGLMIIGLTFFFLALPPVYRQGSLIVIVAAILLRFVHMPKDHESQPSPSPSPSPSPHSPQRSTTDGIQEDLR